VTCSSRSNALLESHGADLYVNYKKPEEEQVEELISKTEGKLYRVLDATSYGIDFAKKLLAKIEGGPKYFSSTDDWTPIDESKDFKGVVVDRIGLGPVGNPEAVQLNSEISSYVPLIVKLIENGKVRVSEYEIAGQGYEAVDHAWQYQKSGKAGSKKVLVQLQEA
jgi:NADPH:quinone reductase-like Zn-dependent oxidoreductase